MDRFGLCEHTTYLQYEIDFLSTAINCLPELLTLSCITARGGIFSPKTKKKVLWRYVNDVIAKTKL